jgi:hypothetical protein
MFGRADGHDLSMPDRDGLDDSIRSIHGENCAMDQNQVRFRLGLSQGDAGDRGRDSASKENDAH